MLTDGRTKIISIFHFGEFSRIFQSFNKFQQCFDSNSIGSKEVFKFCLDNNIKLIYSATSASLGNKGMDKNLSPYAFTKAKNLELLENLKKWGFEVDQAVDGRDCLRQFEADKYDLIVMDLQMPELDGFEASQEIRKLEQEVNQGRVSILALSASVMGEVWKKCESSGMNGYLSKPFETEELQQKVKQILTELDADIDQIKSGKVEGNN